jgi:hypothetical protein
LINHLEVILFGTVRFLWLHHYTLHITPRPQKYKFCPWFKRCMKQRPSGAWPFEPCVSLWFKCLLFYWLNLLSVNISLVVSFSCKVYLITVTVISFTCFNYRYSLNGKLLRLITILIAYRVYGLSDKCFEEFLSFIKLRGA